jgi:hypothetical protein
MQVSGLVPLGWIAERRFRLLIEGRRNSGEVQHPEPAIPGAPELLNSKVLATLPAKKRRAWYCGERSSHAMQINIYSPRAETVILVETGEGGEIRLPFINTTKRRTSMGTGSTETKS